MGRQVALAGELSPTEIADLMRTPGGRIRFMRLTKQESQTATARAVNVSQPMVSQWERDEWLPSVELQYALSEHFGVLRNFLFGDVPSRSEFVRRRDAKAEAVAS